MSLERQEKTINWRIREWFPLLDDRAQERLRIYHLELLRWSKTINLISRSSAADADLVHFADSILGLQVILEDLESSGFPNEVWDLGSGNGFPGVVLSILRPQLGVLCVEVDERKASFLKQISLRLELETLGVRRERVENLPKEAIVYAVARGFAPIGSALAMTTKQVPTGGAFYHFKGPDWIQEVQDIRDGVGGSWKNQLLKEYRLSFDAPGTTSNKGALRAIVKSTRK